jgi:hypothetical protein
MLKELPEAVVLLGLSDPEDTFLGHQEAYFTESPFPAESSLRLGHVAWIKKAKEGLCALYQRARRRARFQRRDSE